MVGAENGRGEMANDERRAGLASACRRNRLADIAAMHLSFHHRKQQGLHFIQLWRWPCWQIWQVRPRRNSSRGWMSDTQESKLAQADTPMPEQAARALIITARRW